MRHQRQTGPDRIGSLLAAILVTLGMVSSPAIAGPRVFIPPAPATDIHATNETVQAGVRMTHRAVLSIADRDVALTGAMTQGPDGEIRLAILAGIGIVLAEVHVPAGGAPEVVRSTPPFRARWARKFVLRDALRLFAHDQLRGCREARGTDGRRTVEGCMPDGTRLRLTFAPGSQAPDRIEALTRTGGPWVAECEEPKRFEALGRTLPTRYRLNAGAYRLDLTLLSAEPVSKVKASSE